MGTGAVSSPRQLPLGLGHAPALTRADFIVGDANRAAIELIDRWPDWPYPAVLLAGPAGSGKSHLAAIWQASSAGDRVAAAAVAEGDVVTLAASATLVVEDLSSDGLEEAALFHLFNLARERGMPLLLTSRTPAVGLRIGLPDLASRLRAAHLVSLGPPDDDLLRRVLVKLLADRQLVVEPPVIETIVIRMERSLAAANALVDLLDRTALAEGRPITRQLAGTVLDRLAQMRGEGDES